ncbi:hypothetical protein [Methanococcoides sp.]|uniref:hypothetical protein n=1 Tax=Methanococcoides sp. TaxID=1966350 RepID=UPI00272E8B00|nr:hypothetical protein [Methanococcoides sp.]
MKLNILIVFISLLVLVSVPTSVGEYNYEEVNAIIYEAAEEIEPDFTEDAFWYVGDAEHVGVVYFSERDPLKPEMQSIDYWDMDERMILGEFSDQTVTSSVSFVAPTPGGDQVYVDVDGYNLPLSAIQPVAENIFVKLVDHSVASGAVGQWEGMEDTQTDEYPEETPIDEVITGTAIGDSEELSDQYQNPEEISTGIEDTAENEDTEFTEYDEVDELFFIYEVLEEEGFIENEGYLAIEDIDKQDIEDYQNVHMNYVLPDDFVESMQTQATIINMIREESSEDMEKLDDMDLGDGQNVESNKEKIKQVFEEDFTFEAGSPVEITGGADYAGKDKVGSKLNDIMNLEIIDKDTKDTIEKIKTGHEAASFFSDDYSNSKLAKTFDKIDKINSLKEEVNKYVGAYNDYEKLSEMKGASGTTVKALYVVSKTGQEVADKVPIVGEFIKKELEIVEKIVMALPELDNAIKNGNARQGRITSGGIGTSTPNAFLSEYGKVKQTSDGPVYYMLYTDEKGEKQEINPDLWIKVTVKGESYYVPTDEDENPIGDVAIKDIGSSWKPWKWDNCQVVKRTDPKVIYNNGEEYDL